MSKCEERAAKNAAKKARQATLNEQLRAMQAADEAEPEEHNGTQIYGRRKMREPDMGSEPYRTEDGYIRYSGEQVRAVGNRTEKNYEQAQVASEYDNFASEAEVSFAIARGFGRKERSEDSSTSQIRVRNAIMATKIHLGMN